LNTRDTIVALTLHIRDQVRPHLGSRNARSVTGTSASGDATFAIDDIAEHALVEFVERRGVPLAYYSEDKGLQEFGKNPELVLVIDPIDGTRPAMAGFEQCVVAVSGADYTASPTMGDVRYACAAELKRDDVFVAERGHGAVWMNGDGIESDIALMDIHDLKYVPISFEAVSRPFNMLGVVLDDIVNLSSMKGGCFLFNSTAYSLTRLLTGQLGGVLDVGNRILRDRPGSRPRFVEIGGGTPIGLFTYDIAAAALIASEAGAVVTDAYGHSFANVPLLDTSESNLQSICATADSQVHDTLLRMIEKGISRLPD
jgi:myo-inositol-1(or 4)-monophosphatase